MRKIIKEGITNTYVTVCPYCGCKFIYQDDDLCYGDCVDCPMDGCHNTIVANKVRVTSEDLEEMKLNA